MEPSDRLDVVVEDLRTGADDDGERLLLDTEKVGRQHFDACLRQARLQRPNRRRIVAGPAVRHVVAVDRRDDHVLQLHLRGSVRQPQRLERIGRVLGPPGMDVAIATRTGAGVAEDLERRRAATPALGLVGTAGLLTDRVELLPMDELLDVEVARVRARSTDLHPLRAAGPVSYWQRALHEPDAPRRTG